MEAKKHDDQKSKEIITKKVTIARFTEEGRKQELERQKNKFENRGWNFKEYIDGGMSNSHAIFEGKKGHVKIGWTFKKVALAYLGVCCVMVIVIGIIKSGESEQNLKLTKSTIENNIVQIKTTINNPEKREIANSVTQISKQEVSVPKSHQKIKDRIKKLAQMYKLLIGKHQEHSKNKNSNGWAYFTREFRKEIEILKGSNSGICNGTRGCFDFNMCYSSLDMAVLQAGRILYRVNYPPKDYQHFKNEFVKHFTNIGGNKFQLMQPNEKVKGKNIWYVMNNKTGKGYISNKTPKLKTNEISIGQKDMKLYERFDKEIFKQEYAAMDDKTMTKTIAKKWKISIKKLNKINIHGVLFKQALQKGNLEDKR